MVLLAIKFADGTCVAPKKLVIYVHRVKFPANSSQVTSETPLGGGCTSYPPYNTGFIAVLRLKLTLDPEYNSTQVGTAFGTILAFPSHTVSVSTLLLDYPGHKGQLRIYGSRSLGSDALFTIQGGTGDFEGAIGRFSGKVVNTYGQVNAVSQYEVLYYKLCSIS